MKSSNESNGHKIYVPVIFPPCTDIYFISKNIDSMSFYDDVRKKLLEIIGRNLISMYDTCGFNPLLLIIDAESPSKLDSFINSAREREIDIRPTFMSFTVSPKSIIKRFGMIVDNKKGELLLNKVKENPVVLDLFKYITDKLSEIPDSEYSEERGKEILLKEIQGIKNKDTKILIEEANIGLNIFDASENTEECLKKTEDAKKYLDEKFIKYVPLVISPLLAIIFLRFPIKSYLFSRDAEFEDDLNSGIASDKLKNKFKTEGFPISENAMVTKEKDDKWVVTDGEKIYIVKKENGKLNIYIKSTRDEISSVINDLKKDSKVTDIYEIIGDHEYIIKAHFGSISELYSFCEKLYEIKIQTITKCILRTWKEEWWEPEKPILPVYPPLNLRPLQDNILRILCDERRSGILKEDMEGQIGLIRDLGVTGSHTKIEEAIKEVRKKIIYRTSVKLERRNWLKTMIFITAALGRKRELKTDINAMLLGVDERTFARKFYHVTGIVDFIVLLDCMNLYALRDKIGKFTKECGDKIRDIRIHFELGGEEQIETFELTPCVLARINSLIPNSEKFKETKYGTIGEGEDYPTRYHYYEWEVGNRKDEIQNLSQSAREQDEAFSMFPQALAGLIPASEIHPDVMIHAFVRFKFSKENKFRHELNEIVQERRYSFLKIYDPIQDYTVIECVIVTKGFSGLFNFVKRLDRYCKLSEVNVIFHQEFFKPAIPEGLRCKPCRLPVGEPCDACEFYTSKRTMTTIKTIDFGINTMKKCRIAIVQIIIPESDPETWLSRAKDGMDFKDKICGFIKNAIKGEADIIVFPELSIPKEFIDDIKRVIAEESNAQKRRGKIFVVAGSDYKWYKNQQGSNPYNNSPIILCEDGKTEIYEQQKNIQCDPERRIANAKGILRFINTGFGDFAVLLCRDILEMQMINELSNRIDILVFPTWDETFGRENVNGRTIVNHIDRHIKQESIFTVVASNGIYGGSGVYGPFARNSDESGKLEGKIIQKGEEKMDIYKIDIMDLDENRGKGDRRDKKYLAMPNAKRRHENKIRVYQEFPIGKNEKE